MSIVSIHTVLVSVVLYFLSQSLFTQNIKNSIDSISPKHVPSYFQDRHGNLFSTTITESPFLLPYPGDLNISFELDRSGKYFRITERFKHYFFRTPSQISFEDFKTIQLKKNTKDYWKNISTIQNGGKRIPGQVNKLIPAIKIGKLGERLFGGSEINIDLNGSLLLDFGGRWQRTENPSIPVRQQRNGSFNFSQQISTSFEGEVGKKLKINGNFDTKNVFQLNQNIKFSYTNFEEDIIQDFQFGNIKFPVKNSLIKGAHNLFGVSTKLRFGKLYINALFSSQRGTSEEIIIKNGKESNEFQIKADAYDSDRHFFIGHFFRDHVYAQSLQELPVLVSNVLITRIEVYVTNRESTTETLRNFVAFTDLGEQDPSNSSVRALGNLAVTPQADNQANRLFEILLNESLSRKQGQIREAFDAIDSRIGSSLSDNLQNGRDYELLNGARRLKEEEYTFHPQLGFISLNRALRNDEVLAVAYEYNDMGRIRKVGELTEDYQQLEDQDVIFLKLLKPSVINPKFPTWDLLMKNIYRIQSPGIRKENFQLRIIYKDDKTGQDNPSLHEGGSKIKNIPLIRLMNLDNLNFNLDAQPDGNFDFVEGLTVDSKKSIIFFPVLEPFGEHLQSLFESDDAPNRQELIDRYVYHDLYRLTQADATLNATKDKFVLIGSYQSGSSNEIYLRGFNISEGSVVVKVGNTKLNESQYNVDYAFGKLTILDPAILSTGQEIRILYERSDVVNTQSRLFTGIDMQYHFNKKIKFSGTLLHLNERPIITRVRIGEEPARNTVWGIGLSYTSSSRLLTKIVDAIPFLSTKAESKFTFEGEFAQILPSSSAFLGKEGISYIDDFENSEVLYSLESAPNENWRLGSVPQLILNRFPVNSSRPLSHGFKRAKLSWYSIDNLFYFRNGAQGIALNITDKDLQNHYARPITFNEVFRQRQGGNIATRLERSFDLAFYPKERGPYNFNPDLDLEGMLLNPKENFGTITRAINNHSKDFDNINIQYIEFWLLDPFINGMNGQINGRNNTTGGEIYFNLGNVSEDVIPDGKHFFENGLKPQDGFSDITPWGKVPNTQYVQNAFEGDRTIQDIGLDGLNDEEEADDRFFGSYLSEIRNKVSPRVFEKISSDPASDNFSHFLKDEFNKQSITIPERYKEYNNTQNNSPINQGGAFSFSSTNRPDNEDLNQDNTLSSIEQYYQYKIDLRPESLNLDHLFIVDEVKVYIDESKDSASWYQFRIPIRDNPEIINDISGFKSIRYVRIFLTDWQEPVILRFIDMQLVGSRWRKYERNLPISNSKVDPEKPPAEFDITSVNIEENGKAGDGSIPYVLPPGTVRDRYPTSLVIQEGNEQSLQLCVEELPKEEGVAIYKNIQLDVINYKGLRMFIHTQSDNSRTNDLQAVFRIGTDFEENYYEISWNLQVTPEGSIDKRTIWPEDNVLDITFDQLSTVKIKRNRLHGRSSTNPYIESIGKYQIKIMGSPDLSDIQTIMMGVRNNSSQNSGPLDVCLWFNELRVVGFDRRKGWTTQASIDVQLADFATLKMGISYNTFGYGGVQDKLIQRARESTLSYNFFSNIQLDRFLFYKIGIKLPLHISYQQSTATPQFDPRDKDVKLQTTLNSFESSIERDAYSQTVQSFFRKRSISLNNVRKVKLNPDAKTHLWDIENLSFSASYTDELRRDLNTFEYRLLQWSTSVSYTYNNSAKSIEPFKQSEGPSSPYLQLIKDFNFSLLPSSISVRGALNRNFIFTQLRNSNLDTVGIAPTYERNFIFKRNYSMQWDFTKNLSFTYDSQADAIIDDPTGELNDPIREKDSLLSNLRNFGRLKNFSQNIATTYNIPFDKFPLTNWIEANISYKASYAWKSASINQINDFGHLITNRNNTTANAKVNLGKIYSHIPILKDISKDLESNSNTAPSSDPLQTRTDRIENKLKQLQEKIKRKREKMTKGKSTKTDNAISFPEDSSRTISKLILKKEKWQARLTELKKKKESSQNEKSKLAKGLGGILLSLKNIDIIYSQTNSTEIPGFKFVPFLFGLEKSAQSPGIPFILGVQDANIIRNNPHWLIENSRQGQPFKQISSEKIIFRTILTPIQDLKISLSAERSRNNSFSEIYRYIPSSDEFESQSIVRTGNFNTSFSMLFTTSPLDRADAIFARFEENRNIILDRLSLLNDNTGEYDTTSQDVLIPAFLAAYTGKNVHLISLSAFPRIPIPNWELTYSGLKNLPFFEKRLKSISIRHSYSSTYSTGSYTSPQLYGNEQYRENLVLNANERDLIFPISSNSSVYTPLLIINAVVLNENFSPLVGVQFITNKDLQFKVNYNRSRQVVLGLSNPQVNETISENISLEINFSKLRLKTPFKIRGKSRTLKNDLDFRFRVIFNNTKIVQRKFKQPAVTTAGNLNLQIKPTISYKLNQWGNLQFYFEYTLFNPYVSSSYPRRTTSAGIQLRISLDEL